MPVVGAVHRIISRPSAGPSDTSGVRIALPNRARGLERFATWPCSQYYSGGLTAGVKDVDFAGTGMELSSWNPHLRRSPRADDHYSGRYHGPIFQRGLEEMAQAQANAARR